MAMKGALRPIPNRPAPCPVGPVLSRNKGVMAEDVLTLVKERQAEGRVLFRGPAPGSGMQIHMCLYVGQAC